MRLVVVVCVCAHTHIYTRVEVHQGRAVTVLSGFIRI